MSEKEHFFDQYYAYFNSQLIKANLKRPRFNKHFKRGLERIQAWSEGKTECLHSNTKVCYREDYAGGDLVVWKEFCNECYKNIRCGMGRYVCDIPGRTVMIDPKTKYDEGYIFTL